MTLLVTSIAAVIATIIWYCNPNARKMKIGILCYMFWGASLMWLVDAVFEYIELRADYFLPSSGDMLNDLFLGLSVIVLALIVWVADLLLKDPKHVIKSVLEKKSE